MLNDIHVGCCNPVVHNFSWLNGEVVDRFSNRGNYNENLMRDETSRYNGCVWWQAIGSRMCFILIILALLKPSLFRVLDLVVYHSCPAGYAASPAAGGT